MRPVVHLAYFFVGVIVQIVVGGSEVVAKARDAHRMAQVQCQEYGNGPYPQRLEVEKVMQYRIHFRTSVILSVLLPF